MGIDAMLSVNGVPLCSGTAVKVKISDFVHAKENKTQESIYFLFIERMELLLDDNDTDLSSHVEKELQCANQEELHITLHVDGETLENKDAGR